MNWLDYIIVGILTLSGILSIMRGFARELISLAAWILALILSMILSDNLSFLLKDMIHQGSPRIVVAFVLLFVGTLLIAGLTGMLVSSLIDKAGLTGTDRVLGMLFGLLRGALIVCVLIIIGSMAGFSAEHGWRKSLLLPYFVTVVQWIVPLMPDGLARYVKL